LVVDDDAEMTRLLSRMVRSLVHDCQVQTTESGRDALVLLGQRRPDVVLLDLFMPDITGYDVLERMRADPALTDIPILVVTARGYEDVAMIADTVTIARLGGLQVGEIMRWISGVLNNCGYPRSAPRHPTVTPG
jgi:CheY-like chemotaxis protein